MAQVTDTREHGLTELYGYDDESPMPPRTFFEQMAPAWARVWNEVADEHKDADLPWKDNRVAAQFMRLTGFHPKQLEFAAELGAQQRGLRRAREVSRALYTADEIEQLDGMPALDFAHGWMVALLYLAGLETCMAPEPCNRCQCPPPAHMDMALATSVQLHEPASREHFSTGFRRCLAEKLTESDCSLRCKR